MDLKNITKYEAILIYRGLREYQYQVGAELTSEMRLDLTALMNKVKTDFDLVVPTPGVVYKAVEA